MNDSPELTGRRPLKSRASLWARGLSAHLARSGVTPNTISVFSVVFSMGAAAVAISVGLGCLYPIWLLGAAVLIQLRLVCNLMDGMVAIEGGKKSPTGDLFNEVPDRFADLLILVSMGFCSENQPWGIHLGWLAAALAVLTAYIRVQGALLTGKHDFRGPMAKPQRMALATVTFIFAALLPNRVDWVFIALIIMVAGEALTVCRRLRGISTLLHQKS